MVSAGADGRLCLWDAATGHLLRIHQLAQGAHAVWEPDPPRLIEASDGAWRWLVWQCFDDQGRLTDVLPAETFGPLPPPQRLALPSPPAA